jgi:hypothetical protein
VNNSATVAINVQEQNVAARISGGGARQVGRSSELKLDGSGSEDPDESAAPFSFSWECAATSTSASCDGLSLTASEVVTVTPNALPIGTYEFTLTVAKGSRTDSKVALVEIVSGSPPVVSIASLESAQFNANAGFLSVSGSVDSSLSYASIWTVESSDVAEPFLIKALPAPNAPNKISTAVNVAALTAGSQYTFRLSATDISGESCFSTVTLLMNEAPSSGSLSIVPPSGLSLETDFVFSALNWVDADLPFTYTFGTARVHPDGSMDTSGVFPFGNEQSETTLTNVILGHGDASAQYAVSCFATVIDAFGAAGSNVAVVHVLPVTRSVGSHLNISEVKATQALDSGNADASKQVLAATMASLLPPVGGRRLSLGGSSGGAVAARAAVLDFLRLTYVITPISQSQVTS